MKNTPMFIDLGETIERWIKEEKRKTGLHSRQEVVRHVLLKYFEEHGKK